jgi:C4-dicarboxylate-specific signal transduction histidine kinase
VLPNVVMNAGVAIAAIEDGPREIAIETRRGAPGRVVLSVRDTGIGVKDADLERIFEEFVSSKPDGLGMGLAISHSIAQAHGRGSGRRPTTRAGGSRSTSSCRPKPGPREGAYDQGLIVGGRPTA